MIIQKRLKRLEKVVDEFLFYTRWEAVNVFLVNGDVFVSWIKPRVPTKGDIRIYLDYTSRTFPVTDLNRRIRSYKDKIVVAKAKLEEEKG